MKKLISLLIAIVLAVSMVVSSFSYYGRVTWDEPEAAGKFDGKSLNDGSIGAEVNRIRMNWTASRAMPQENAMFVDLDGNTAVKITGTEYITSDYALKGKAYVAVDLKVVNSGTFCGLVIDCDAESGYGSSSNTTFEATHDRYILYSGYGFTLKDKNTIVAFVNASATDNVDAKEFALGFDASEAFHTYSIYRDEAAKKSYLMVDAAVIVVFDFSKDDDHVGIYSADEREMYVNTNNNWNTGNIWFAVVGSSEVYLDNIGYNDKPDDGAYLYETIEEGQTDTSNNPRPGDYAEADDYLSEMPVKGKTDVLTGAKETLYCSEEMNNELDIGTLLTDGIISCNDYAEKVEKRIHLNHKVGSDSTVEFPGVSDSYIYAVEFKDLKNVTVDSFILYYAGQYENNLAGRDIPSYHADTNVVILASTDNGATFKTIFESDCEGGIGADEEYSVPFEDDETVDGAKYRYILCEITLDAPVTGITNLVYAAPQVRPNGGDWAARISEFSAYAPTELEKAPNGFVNASFDSINVNGTVNFGAGDGKASEKMQPVDGTKGDVKSVTLRGWAGFDQAITAFGYRINGKDTFVDGKDFKLTTEDAVRLPENGGANGSRFAIEIPTAGLTGENTIVAVVRLADDTVVALDDQFNEMICAANVYCSPNTTFTYIGPADYPCEPDQDTLQIVFDDVIVTCGKDFTVNANVTNNPGFMMLMATAEIPSDFVLKNVENGEIIADFTNGTQYLWISDENVYDNGKLITLGFHVPEDIEPGEYQIGFTVRSCGNYAEERVPTYIAVGMVKVLDFVFGDATGDDIVDGLDLIRLKKFLANYDYETETSTVEIGKGADANGDGIIDGLDLIRLKKYLTNYDCETMTSTIELGPKA